MWRSMEQNGKRFYLKRNPLRVSASETRGLLLQPHVLKPNSNKGSKAQSIMPFKETARVVESDSGTIHRRIQCLEAALADRRNLEMFYIYHCMRLVRPSVHPLFSCTKFKTRHALQERPAFFIDFLLGF